MTVDPTDPETFAEQDASQENLDTEAPEADAAEQQTDLTPQDDDSPAETDPDKANEADRLDQARIVSINEDDYR
ncbi:hypothetical protein ACFY93_00040 [Streptomyces sp. NPDC008313]|uniref:hypothetical protein n=1 Tax=Streptomyces sp. NPDC008313 TaxID=3364826 RepID=UPI0036EA40A1